MKASHLSVLISIIDQDPYDFIDPNPDEEATLSEGDLQHNAPYVSCIKVSINICTDPYVSAFIILSVKQRHHKHVHVYKNTLTAPHTVKELSLSHPQELERVLKTHQSKDKENWKEESG